MVSQKKLFTFRMILYSETSLTTFTFCSNETLVQNAETEDELDGELDLEGIDDEELDEVESLLLTV